MTEIPFQDGKVVMRDGKVGTGQACCCEKLPNCCEEQSVLLQVKLEIDGLADDTWSGCGCLNGTYVADVVDVITSVDPPFTGLGFGDSVQPQPGCIAVDQDANEYIGHVALTWSCTGDYAEADWGFKSAPWQVGEYPLTDMMRVAFGPGGLVYGDTATAGVSCVGGSASGFVVFNAEFGCDYTNLTATITVS